MDFCFYLITDRRATAPGMEILDVLASAFEAGVKGVLLREKDMPDDELFGLAGRVRDLSRRYRARFLVSGRVDVALSVDADGVHIPSTGIPVHEARALIGDEKYLAVSTHSLQEALDAQEGGADFITFGPVYHTPSKAVYGPPAGLDALADVCKGIKIPVFALGGVKNNNVADTLKAGAYGAAVISAVMGSPDPAKAAREIMDIIRDYKLRRLI